MSYRRQRVSLPPVYPYPANPMVNDVPYLPQNDLPRTALPPILSMLPPIYSRDADLSAISRGKMEIPPDNFNLSPRMQQLQGDDGELFDGIIKECRKYAEGRKELVRGAFKKRQREARLPLSTIDKSKLRSRREAKVTRVKEREFEAALKDVIRWFIAQRSANAEEK